MRIHFYTKIAALAEERTWLMLGIALLITVVAAAFAGQLELRMQFKNMMPQSHPTVQEYDRIVDQYSSASSLIVVVRGRETDAKAFADELASKIRSMPRFFRRVDFKVNTDFMREHGFMLVKAKDLENIGDQFRDLGLVPFLANLNDSFEKTYVSDSESISNGEKEDKAVGALDGIEYWLRTMQEFVDGNAGAADAERAVDQFLIGDPYFISQDKDMVLLFVQPTFTMNDIAIMVSAVNAVDSLIVEVGSKYPDVDAGSTGTLALGRDEMEAISSDMYVTTIIAFVLILGLFIVSFRMWAAPVLAGLSLLIGIVWTSGFAAITVGSLNMMTSMFGVILVGLGIDYNIHIISGYTEFRAEGASVGESMRLAITKTGNGIVIGAASTALAFLTMLISENLGMKEFALITGMGVLFCMLSSLFVLPSMLVFRDRVLSRKNDAEHEPRSITYAWTGRMAEMLASKPIPVLAFLAVTTALLLYSALNISFDYNYLNMEPKGLKSIELQDAVIEEFDVTPDMVLVTASSVEAARAISEQAKELRSVGMVTTISDYVPSEAERLERIPHIEKIRSDLSRERFTRLREEDAGLLIEELFRLEDNVIELAQLAFVGGQDKVDRKARRIIGDLEQPAAERGSLVAHLVDSFEADLAIGSARLQAFESAYIPELRSTALAMTSVDPVSVSILPAEIRNQFVSDDGSQYLVSIYPREQVWDFEFLGRFTEQMHKIDPRVTGLPPIFYVLIEYIARDGRKAAMLAVSVIFLLLWLDFRRIVLAMIAMLSLVIGAVWMVGLMNLFGMQFNLVNVIGIPLILGIGIDDAVHILNRYRVEGRGRLAVVFSSTGKAIILTSLTTMIAFGSLGFAVYRGLGSLGITLLIGVGTALLTTLFLVPVLLGLLDRKASGHADESNTMKTSSDRKAKVKTVLSFLPIVFLAGFANAQDQRTDVLEIVRRIDTNERVESSRSVARQIITTSSGRERTLELESYAIGQNEKMLSVYTGPARVRGDKILMLNDGDDIWFYTPKTDRVRHLASHARRQKVQGSDFSYEDLITGNMEEDYTHTLLGEEEMNGVAHHKIESTPTDSGPSYSKIIIWAEKERHVVRQIDYYDEGALLKRLVSDDIREIDGHWIPFRMEMTNLRDGGKTVFEFVEMELNVELDDKLFTTNNLKKR